MGLRKEDVPEVVISFPTRADAQFYNKEIVKILGKGQTKHLVFDFAQTQSIDQMFYCCLHDLKRANQHGGDSYQSVHLSDKLVEQLKKDKVYHLFNTQAAPAKPSSAKIDVEFISPFISAAIEILKVQAKTEVTPSKPVLKSKEAPPVYDIVGILSLVSNVFQGSVALCFKKETFLHICSQMFEEECTEITDEIEDAAGELINMIFGSAKAELNNKADYKIEKALPTVLRGEGIKVKQATGPTIILPFESTAGQFQIEIELCEQKG